MPRSISLEEFSGTASSPTPQAAPKRSISLDEFSGYKAPQPAQSADIDPTKADGATLKFGPWDTGVKLGDGTYRALAGAGKFFNDTQLGARQLTAHALGLPSASKLDAEANDNAVRDAPLMRTKAGFVGNLAGGAIATAPLGAVLGGARVVNAARTGLMSALLAPTETSATPSKEGLGNGDYFGNKVLQAGLGAGLGVVSDRVVKGVGNVVRGVADPVVQQLKNAGVNMTVGQILGGSARSIENGLTSVPILGDMIKARQADSIKSFNTGFINQSLAPIGQKLDNGLSGHAAIDQAGQKLSDAYDALLPNLKGKLDQPFQQLLGTVRQMGQSMPAERADQLNRIIANEVEGRFTNAGLASGDTLKSIESKLGEIYRPYQRSSDYDVRNLGNALSEVQSGLRSMIERNNPSYQNQLGPINQGYAQYLRALNASARAGTHEGVFTPAQSLAAIKALDPSKNKAAYAKGNALMQDFAGAAQQILPSNIPDSGTAFRQALQIGVGGLAGLGVSGISPALTAATLGLGLGTAGYSRVGQSAASKLLLSTPLRSAIANTFDQAAKPFAAPATVNSIMPSLMDMLTETDRKNERKAASKAALQGLTQ
ncbi:hypothetical protein HQ393_10390 [Chitinibacter bivalviorum]|uniref:Uncharacterized protein n=1 Tax=Chitinibacter bivalviorum TaxID=2739434 RepID=A0A7H9BJR3_9NEIS|nr:hypothetical protein [Chitinibacter bivalviorum]QLG88612.1 hypothetical protein HQ393_10390 [Chitinibacter bivalviorum]